MYVCGGREGGREKRKGEGGRERGVCIHVGGRGREGVKEGGRDV